MAVVVCETCGKNFDKHEWDLERSKHNYCSSACFYQRNFKTIYCEYCNKEFTPRPTLLKIGRGRFCSQECAHAATKSRSTFECPMCGKSFEISTSRIMGRKTVCCSRKCSQLYNQQKKNNNSSNLYRDETWLRNEYEIKEKSITVIANEIGVSNWTIHEWLLKFDIPVTTRKRIWTEESRLTSAKRMRENSPSKRPEVRKKISESHMGELAPNWKGGISFEPYCPKFNKKFKNEIRERFEFKCYLCGVHENTNSRCLGIHHIDYNKNSICNGHDWAFVPLCSKCHGITGHNRWHWFNRLIYYWLEKYDLNFDNM